MRTIRVNPIVRVGSYSDPVIDDCQSLSQKRRQGKQIQPQLGRFADGIETEYVGGEPKPCFSRAVSGEKAKKPPVRGSLR